MKRYKIDRYYATDIQQVEVVSETEHFITLQFISWDKKKCQRREKKDGSIFSTWEEARHALVMRAQAKIQSYENNITTEKENLRKLDNMVGP